jgi:hypothetical protein
MSETADAASRRACDWCGGKLRGQHNVLKLDAVTKLYCSSRCNDMGFRAELSRPIFQAPGAMRLRQAILAWRR